MWCNIPLVDAKYSKLKLPDQIPTDVKVRLRVKKNFRTYAGAVVLSNSQSLSVGSTYYVASIPVIHDGNTI